MRYFVGVFTPQDNEYHSPDEFGRDSDPDDDDFYGDDDEPWIVVLLWVLMMMVIMVTEPSAWDLGGDLAAITHKVELTASSVSNIVRILLIMLIKMISGGDRIVIINKVF